MPTYQYACTDCLEPLEVHQSFSDDALTVCPACQGRLRKVFSAVGVVFKGSGFYQTDSRSNGANSRSGSSTDGDSGSGDGTSDSTKGKEATKNGSTSSTGSGSTGSGSTGSTAGDKGKAPAAAGASSTS